jgi:hydrogenase maturation protease
MTPAPPGRPRVLIAGVGNIFLGDDGFGVAVAQRLARRELPAGARAVDFGIRGLDLAYALLEPYEAVILVDAAPRGGPPGTLYVLEPGPAPAEGPAAVDAHDLTPERVLRLAAALGGPPQRLLVVGCEPGPAGDAEDVPEGLSAPVLAAVDEAARLVEALAARLLGGDAAACGVETIPGKEVRTCRTQDRTV